jgi:hypothetical protein
VPDAARTAKNPSTVTATRARIAPSL